MIESDPVVVSHAADQGLYGISVLENRIDSAKEESSASILSTQVMRSMMRVVARSVNSTRNIKKPPYAYYKWYKRNNIFARPCILKKT